MKFMLIMILVSLPLIIFLAIMIWRLFRINKLYSSKKFFFKKKVSSLQTFGALPLAFALYGRFPIISFLIFIIVICHICYLYFFSGIYVFYCTSRQAFKTSLLESINRLGISSSGEFPIINTNDGNIKLINRQQSYSESNESMNIELKVPRQIGIKLPQAIIEHLNSTNAVPDFETAALNNKFLMGFLIMILFIILAFSFFGMFIK